MWVMKFGGASVKNADAVRNVSQIIKNLSAENKLVIVVSAMDKTTNGLEALAQVATRGDQEAAYQQLYLLKDFHFKIVDELFENAEVIKIQLQQFFKELHQITQGILFLGDYPTRVFDRIMAYGELLSSIILFHHLDQLGLAVEWKDARKVIKTNSNFGSADIVWGETENNILSVVGNTADQGKIVVIQGYIGSNAQGSTTTLGREGSDFTASILGHVLNAEKVVVWKDVKGVLSGDPRIFPDAVKIDYLSYEQAVEMTFYGATVIHPKTIKPLQNKKIPLHVKCFLDPDAEGTWIGKEGFENKNLPVQIIKKDQMLVSITPKDFSFMDTNWTLNVYNYLTQCRLSVNLVQTSAVSIQMCMDKHASRFQDFVSLVHPEFFIHFEDQLILKSIINADKNEQFLKEDVLMAQKNQNNVHLVLRENSL